MEVDDDEVMVARGMLTDPIESFRESGPKHLTSTDWNNSYYITAVTSCLVQGVYILERDRQKKLKHIQSQADPLWWEFFNFTLSETLIDQSDGSIYGAVFSYNYFYNYSNIPHSRPPPCHVIAFRGTMVTRHSGLRDLCLNIKLLCNSLYECSALKHAIDVIKRMVANTGNHEAVWLSGHSLGAAFALLAGKKMMRSGFPLESYLFNPPFPSFPVEKLVMNNEKLERGVRFAGSLAKAVAVKVLKVGDHHKGEEDDPFMRLASWKPYLYLNPSDPICSGYIGYFKHRARMFEIGAGKIGNIATKHTLASLFTGAGGGGSSSSDSSSEPLHLLPSAYSNINTSTSSNLKDGHGLHQWWDPMRNAEYALHQCNQ